MRVTLDKRAAAGIPRGMMEVVTPEGVPLRFALADAGERAGAFLIDLFILALVCVGILLGAVLLEAIGVQVGMGGWGVAVIIILLFLLRTFYFAFFELRWKGLSPGKKSLKLQVIDRAGGPLKPEAIVVRNLMREAEFFLPLTIVLGFEATDGTDSMAMLAMLAWTGLLTIFPLCNRDRLRLGDLVAGTCVIQTPRAALLSDLSERDRFAGRARVNLERYVFTPQQLGIYGVTELQALEAVLRRRDVNAADTKREVARRIIKRIDWQDQAGEGAANFDATAFLDAFYAAQRGKLEKGMLFGIHRKDKHDHGAAKEEGRSR
jgi:uncharacterized RDD family membrane protein YckC